MTTIVVLVMHRLFIVRCTAKLNWRILRLQNNMYLAGNFDLFSCLYQWASFIFSLHVSAICIASSILFVYTDVIVSFTTSLLRAVNPELLLLRTCLR